MANPWFKFYGADYLLDGKIRQLSAAQRSCWVTLLCHASQDNGVVRNLGEYQLMIDAGINFQDDEWDKTTGVLQVFKKLGVIKESNGKITITHWAKRQEISLTNAERQANFRARRNAKVTGSNEGVTLDKNREDKKRIDNTFETFWSSYPKKVAKQKAYSAFKRVPESEHAKIVGDLIFRVKSPQWLKDGGQYIPNPTTYLNQERWKDKVELPKNEPPPKTCISCKQDAKGGWVQTSGGVMCTECNNLPRSNKYREMTQGVIKTMN